MNTVFHSQKAVILGPAERITHITPVDSSSACRANESYFIDDSGGSAVHISRQIKKLGGDCMPVFLTGDDIPGDAIKRMAAAEFCGAEKVVPLLSQTCRSVVQGGSVLKSFPVMQKKQSLPGDLLQKVEAAAMCVLCPLPVDGYDLAVDLLSASASSVLLLSDEMLQDAGMALDLAKRASLVVVSDMQLAKWSGCLFGDAMAGIKWLRERGVGDCLVVGNDRVTGFVSGNWVSLSGYESVPDCSVSMPQLLECFLGTLVAVRLKGNRLKDSLQLAMAACSMLREGNAFADLPQLRQESLNRKPMPVSVPIRISRSLLFAKRAAYLASSLLIGISLGSLLG